MASEQKTGDIQEESSVKNEDYFNALDNYFQLKEDYEINYKEKVQKIGRSLKSRSWKIKEISKLKKNRRCINCGNVGGTFFGITTQDDGTKEYTAMCLCHRVNDGKQCGLDIQLRKGKIINASLKEDEVLKNIEQIKQNIISGKLALLFNLELEDVALKEFDDLKSDLEKASDQLKLIEDKFTSNNTIQILNEKTGDPEIINKKEFIKIKMKKLNEFIYKYKEALKLADNEQSNIKKKAFLRDAFETSINEIKPLHDEIRNLQYQECFVESNFDRKECERCDPLIYYVVKREISINNDEIIADEYSIISDEN